MVYKEYELSYTTEEINEKITKLEAIIMAPGGDFRRKRRKING